MKSHRNARIVAKFVFFLAAAILWPSLASAQTTIAKWTWNTSVRNPPAIGSGTASYVGGTAAPGSGEFPTGSGSSDGGQAWSSTTYPPVTFSNGMAGVQFEVSTAGFENIRVRYDAMASSTASRWLLIKYTTDGVNYINDPTGPKAFSGGAWANNRMLDLTGVSAANDNAAFKFRIVAVFCPNAFVANSVSYSANEAYQPVGTTATSQYGTTGTIRFDAVTVLGDPIGDTPPSVTVASATPPFACPGGSTKLTATIVSGANPPSAIPLNVTVDLTAIGGSNEVALLDDGNPPDASGFDFIYTANVSVDSATAPGLKTLPVTVTDHLQRTGAGSISLTIANCTANANSSVVINRVYGAGGNAGAIYNADFVELFNRGASGVNITGWSIQFASATAAGGFTAANSVVPLTGLIPPGRYHLVQLDDAGVNGAAIPTPDAVAGMTSPGIAADAGRVALVEAVVTPIGNDLSAVRDHIGYGATAATYEGAGPAPELSAALQARRKSDGCQDTNQSFNDFEAVAPNLPIAPRNSNSPAAPCATGGCTCRADVSSDGQVNGRDIRGFVQCATAGGAACDCADLTSDSTVTAADIGPFVSALLSGACAP